MAKGALRAWVPLLLWGSAFSGIAFTPVPARAAEHKIIPNPDIPVPEGLQVRIKGASSSGELSKKLHPSAALFVTGSWNETDSRGPESVPSMPDWPKLYSIFFFSLPTGIRPLDTDISPAGSGHGGARFRGAIRVNEVGFNRAIAVSNGQKQSATLSFSLQLEAPAPVLIIDPACADAGLEATIQYAHSSGAPASSPVVAWLHCRRTPAGTAVKLWSGPLYRWSRPSSHGSGGWVANPAAPVIAGVMPLPSNDSPNELTLALVHASGAKPAAQVKLTQTSHRPSRWSLSASLGPTWSTYVESGSGYSTVQVSQLGLTAKVQTLYRFLPSRWDVAASVFGTVTPLSVSPSSLPGARWLGLNFRAGYTLPLDHQGRNRLSLLPGFYAWSMFVPGDQYGIQNLNGPQLVVSYTRDQISKPGPWVSLQSLGTYFKFAFMDYGVSFASPSNHEIAAGAYTGLRFGRSTRTWQLAADYSTLNFAADGFAMSLTTLSFSVGLSIF